MPKGNSKSDYEEYLNDLYTDSFGFEQAMEEFTHLTVKGRAGGSCLKSTLQSAYYNHTLGTLQRKYDSIAFNVGYNDWKR